MESTPRESLGEAYKDELQQIQAEFERDQERMREYEAELKINPGRFDSPYGAGRAAEMLKMPEKEKTYYEQLVTMCVGASSARPELAHARDVLRVVSKNN